MDAEHSGVDDDPSVEDPTNVEEHNNIEVPLTESKSEVPTSAKDLVDAHSSSSEQSDKNDGSIKEVTEDGTDTIISSQSKSRSKSTKKKKKKISRINDSNSPEMLSVFNDDKSSNGVETVLSSASKKSKGGKKKKKKSISLENDESVDVVSIGQTSTSKSSPKKKKKNKKISRGEAIDAAPSERSLMTGSVKSSKSRSKSMKSPKSPKSVSTKSKKKKVKSSDEDTIPSIQRTKSLDPNLSASNGPNRSQSLDPNEESGFIVKRSMSLDMSNDQFRQAGRMNGRGRGPGGRGRGPPGPGRGRGRGRGPPPPGWQGPRSQRQLERIQSERGFSQERNPYPYGPRGSSHQRSPYGPRGGPQQRPSYDGRSPSQERSLHGGGRGNNGHRLAPTPRGPRRMSCPEPSAPGEIPLSHSQHSRGPPPLQSQHSRGNMYRAPSRPRSILRNSNHGMLQGSSHHRNDRSLTTSSSHSRRVSVDLKAGSRHSYNKYDPHSSYGSDIDSSDVESDDGEDDTSFAMEDSSKGYQKQVPRTVRPGFSRTMSGLGNTSHHGLRNSTSHSTRSLMTIERSEYKNENRFIRFLRYIHLMAPHPDEDPIKKKIRIVTWIALFMDFLNALVANITFGGKTTQCCGQSILTAFGQNVDWEMIILIITIMYMFLIFLEVVPVMREAFPFNLLNPFIGFLITFAVFFSDSIVETAIMWVVEACAVVCEVVVYRYRRQRFAKRKGRLKTTKKEIEKLRKIKRKVKDQFDSGTGRILARADSAAFVLDLNDSSSFAEDSSFFDDVETQFNEDNQTVATRTALTNVSNIGTARETRLLRERRQLIQGLAEDERDLRFHFIGVTFNVFLVVFSLLMLIIIARNGGMCMRDMKFNNFFKDDQLEKCNLCLPEDYDDGPCEKCAVEGSDGESQCYFPYRFGL